MNKVRLKLKKANTKVSAPARKIAGQYRLVIEPLVGVGFAGHALELPGVVADGSTLVECVQATRFAVETAVEAMLRNGLKPPAGSSGSKRTEQVNIRLTSDEKARLLEESVRSGFRGLSEYLRSLALESFKRSVG